MFLYVVSAPRPTPQYKGYPEVLALAPVLAREIYRNKGDEGDEKDGTGVDGSGSCNNNNNTCDSESAPESVSELGSELMSELAHMWVPSELQQVRKKYYVMLCSCVLWCGIVLYLHISLTISHHISHQSSLIHTYIHTYIHPFVHRHTIHVSHTLNFLPPLPFPRFNFPM